MTYAIGTFTPVGVGAQYCKKMINFEVAINQ